MIDHLELRADCGEAAMRGFGLSPAAKLPVVIGGVKFFLSGHKLPHQPWQLVLRSGPPVNQTQRMQ